MGGRADVTLRSAAFERAGVAMMLTDRFDRVIDANPACLQMLGVDIEDLLGRRPLDFRHPDDRTVGRDEIEDVAVGRRLSGAFEVRIVRADGTVGWNRVTVSAMPEGGWVRHAEDITSRKAVEEALARSEAVQRASLDALEQGVSVSDTTGRVVLLNRAGEEILGMSAEEISARVAAGTWVTYDEVGSVLPLDDRPIVQTMTTGEAVRDRIIGWRTADGELRVLRVSTEPVALHGEVGHGVVTAFLDITEARAQERAREADQRRFAALVERSSDPICIVAPDGTVAYASPAAQELLGYGGGALGQPFMDLVHLEDQAMVTERFANLLQTPGATASASVRLAAHDGSWRHVEVLATNRSDDPAIGGVVANVRDVTDRTEAAAQITWQAFHDPLTGLPNRLLLLDRLGHALERSQRSKETVALLYLDVDRFKAVNDILGHEAGDALLLEAAGRLSAAVRNDDTVARFGGDEFVVLCEALHDQHEAEVVASRIRAALARPYKTPRGEATVTVSIGIAYALDHRPETLLQEADRALYRAKENGKDRVEIYDEALRVKAIRRIASEQVLRRALDTGGLTTHFQPIFDLRTGIAVSAEALLRVPGPSGELESPAEFIPIAEESGLIVTIGAGVLHDACAQLATWRREDAQLAPMQVAVNVAARQFAAPYFPDIVDRAVEDAGLVHADLILELTEGTVVAADRSTVRTIDALHERGVELAVDDFGTGYSSLAYLKRFPVSTVKLDRSFVQGLGTDRSDTEIVKAVVSLGHALGLTVVAEGIETAEQLAALRDLGCDNGQGFLLARPCPTSGVVGSIEAAQRTRAGRSRSLGGSAGEGNDQDEFDDGDDGEQSEDVQSPLRVPGWHVPDGHANGVPKGAGPPTDRNTP